MYSASLLRGARKSRQLSQVQLSAISFVDQSSISRVEKGRDVSVSKLDALLAATGHRLYVAPTLRSDASTLAPDIRFWLKQGDLDRALRVLIQLNDNLVSERGLLRGVLGVAEPELLGRPVWDAALAGLVQWRLEEEGLPAPEWTRKPERFLRRQRAFVIDSADPLPPVEVVPKAFLERGVLVWPDMFESV